MTAPTPQPETRGGAAMRLRGLIRKESLQVVRDPSSIAIALVMPVILLLLFGYGVSLDADHVPIALVIEHPGAAATDLAGRFEGSRYFEPRITTSMPDAERELRAREVDAIVRIRGDFARGLQAGGGVDGGGIQVIVSGTDANRAHQLLAYIDGVYQTWLERRVIDHQTAPPLVNIEARLWFNEAARSENFLVPGLIVLIMTLIGGLLTALVMAREWERGTLEALFVTPVRVREVLIGKIVPYFILGMSGMALAVVMAVALFDVPLRGSLGVLVLASAVFLMAALGMGLFISALTRQQFVAAQAALIATFLPAYFLSGFIFDLRSTPWFIRAVSHVVAARYFVAILQSVFLAGDVWSVIGPNLLALVLMAVIFLTLTRLRTRKRLD